MARKKSRGPGGQAAQGAPSQQRPPAGGSGGGGWAPLRDSVRRDIEQAVSALAFGERLHQKMETQRRLFQNRTQVPVSVSSIGERRLLRVPQCSVEIDAGNGEP